MHEHPHDNPEVTASSAVAVAESPVGVGLPRISWGAVFAGLVVSLSIGWLLHLLGLALGVSIADAADSYGMQSGVAVGATIWIILSWAVSLFIGALVTARLAGRIDDFSGMLHGLTLWGVATLATLVMGYYGVSSILQTGYQLGATAYQGVGTVAAGTDDALALIPQGTNAAADALTSEFGRKLRDRLADQAAEIAANADRQLTQAEMRRVIADLDQRTLRRLVLDLTNDDTEGAAQLLADSTDLSRRDANAIVVSAYREMEETFGNPDNNESLTEDLQNQLSRQMDGYIASLDARGGADVSERDIRLAIDSLDNQAMQRLGMELAAGDVRGAKGVLARNTQLTKAEIDELYEGALNNVEREAAQYRQAFNQSVEAVSTYTSQVLWACFAAGAIALIVSLAGGWVGADATRRVYPESETTS